MAPDYNEGTLIPETSMLKRFLPFAALLALACGGETSSDPVPASTPDAVPAPQAPTPAEAAPAAEARSSHCNEATHFSCAVAGGKHLSVCEEEGSLVYFYGVLGAPEKEYPGFGDTPNWSFREISAVSAQGHGLSFTGESHSFEVTEMAGAGGPNAEANNFAGVIVSKGEETVSTIACTGPVSSNWERIAEVMAQ